MQEAVIERNDYKVHFRSYSKNLYGVRVILNGEHHYIINDTLKSDRAIETLYRLMDLSDEYIDYGFIMLQGDNQLFIDYDFKFNSASKRYIHDTSNKVADFKKYKYFLEHGIEKYKNRWDF